MLFTCLIILSALALISLIFAVILFALSVWAAFYFRPPSRAESEESHRIHKLSSETEIIPIGNIRAGPTWIHGRVKSSYPPATSPLSQTPCVYYHFYVEVAVLRGEAGYSSEGWDEIIDDQKSDPFWMEDDTGSVEIEHEGNFQINTDVTFKSGVTNHGLTICDAPEDLRAMLKARYGLDTKRSGIFGAAHKKLRYKESVLENGDEVFIFGEARNENGRYIIGAGTVPLIVSEKGKTDVVDGLEPDDGCLNRVFIGSVVVAFLSGLLILVSIGFLLLLPIFTELFKGMTSP